MIDRLMTGISAWIIAVIAAMGYGGIVLLMAVESACVPLPSEVIMPFSGYLVATGRFGLNLVAIAGAFGCLLGSWVGYYLGATGGRWVLERYGRYVLIASDELETAERFFERWGAPAVFFSRLLPVVRTFIAFPAGVARMRLLPFALYTLAGSYLWCLGLAYIGMQLGQHWAVLGPYFHRLDGLVAFATIAVGLWLIYHRLSSRYAADSLPGERERNG
ncbi:MAG: DedA family protein [Deltaproteobacteria bacterium]|nr:DedA family protein [Deltaproteobacteria bacterium]